MADTPITGLAELAEAPNDLDLIEVVDKSDTSMDAAGTNKKLSIANLLLNAGGGAALQGSAPSKVLIEEITLSTAGEFDFDNIPGDYDRLIIEGSLRGDVTDTVDLVYAFLNSDTTVSNYHKQRSMAAGGTTSSSEAATPEIGLCVGDTGQTDAYAYFKLSIEDYAGGNLKTIFSESNCPYDSTDQYVGESSVQSSITAAVTRVRIRTDNHATDQLLGTLRLYGEKAISIEDSETITVKQKVGTITDPVSGDFVFDLTDFQNGDRVIIEGVLDSDHVGTLSAANIQINGDTTAANYWRQALEGSNGVSNVAEGASNIGLISTGTTSEGAYSQVKLVIENYTSSELKAIRCESDVLETTTDGITAIRLIHTLSESDPVTEIKLVNSDSDNLLGTLTCYIEKQGVLPVINEIPSSTQTGSKILIEEITNVTAGEFDFNNIPSGYDRIIIEGELRGDASVVSETVYAFLNTDTTTSNYHTQRLGADNGSTVFGDELAAPFIGITGDSGLSNMYSDFKFSIEDPNSSRLKKITMEANSFTSISDITKEYTTSLWNDTESITRIRIRTDNHATDQLIGSLKLYGERSISIEDSEIITVKKKVETITNTVAGKFDFQNIPQDGERIIIEGYIQSNVTGAADSIYSFLNNDTTTTNYYYQESSASAGLASVGAANEPNAGVIGGSTTQPYSHKHTIENYSGSEIKIIRTEYEGSRGATESEVGTRSIISSITDPVDRITIEANGDPTEELTGELTLYIEKQGVLPATSTDGKHTIATITDPVSGEFDFTGIPNGYKRLILQGTVVHTASTAGRLFINGDTTEANYWRQLVYFEGATANPSENADSFVVLSPLGSVGATLKVEMEDYAGPLRKRWKSKSDALLGSTELRMYDVTTIHDTITAPVTQITIVPDTGNFTGTLTLYGEY